MDKQRRTTSTPTKSTRADMTSAASAGTATGLSVFASVVALCCIGPWAVALFGVGGAITMSRWQPLRPYILGTALALLAWAFWRVYGPPRRRLCAAGVCSARPSPWLQACLWQALVLVVLAFFADTLQWLIVDPTPPGLRQ